MQKFFLIMCIGFIRLAYAFCGAKEYTVNLEDDKSIFKMFVQTVEQKNCICQLIIHDMEVYFPGEIQEKGIIYMMIGKNPSGHCLMAFGKWRGCFGFNKYSQVPLGEYYLIINDEEYGILVVDEIETKLLPFNET